MSTATTQSCTIPTTDKLASHETFFKMNVTHLPNDIWREIYRHMDLYSLRSLLWAFPQLTRHFVIVSDLVPEKELKAVFFTTPGISIVRISEYNPAVHRRNHLISLYEVADSRRKEYCKILKHDGTELNEAYWDGAVPFLDASSFFYCAHYIVSGVARCLTMSQVGAKLGSHLLVDNSDGFELSDREPMLSCGYPFWPRAMSRTVESFLTGQCTSLANVTRLKIHGLTEVANLTFGSLINFNVHFDRDSSGKRPCFVNVKAAHLIDLCVQYHDHFPHIEGIDIGSALCRPQYPYNGISSVSLIQTEAMSCLTQPLPACKTSLEDIARVDLSFCAKYEAICVIGGHDLIVNMVPMRRHTSLLWKQANVQVEELEEIKASCCIRSFMFETTLPKAKVPRVHFQPTVLRHLIILTHSSFIDTSWLFLHTGMYTRLITLAVYSLGKKRMARD